MVWYSLVMAEAHSQEYLVGWPDSSRAPMRTFVDDEAEDDVDGAGRVAVSNLGDPPSRPPRNRSEAVRTGHPAPRRWARQASDVRTACTCVFAGDLREDVDLAIGIDGSWSVSLYTWLSMATNTPSARRGARAG